jgi:hypothetical protein
MEVNSMEIKIKDDLAKLSQIVYGNIDDDSFVELGNDGFNEWLNGICDDLDNLYDCINYNKDINWFDVYLLGDVINLLRAIKKV